ncbi:Auxin-responsive protein SAUR71 [Striga hermonthica]|uniref:Auxin-responsive protein SAUR71 n=1 Tax=Striga hermonthica TaxID=68872 RepID=A0A9N7P3T0_STRHE|nr:Auxin-responsive protein SAUR71 [Striga hermonthica]
MKKLMRRLSRVADSSMLRSERRTAGGGRVPEGHLPVYVGEEMERFVVSAEHLNHPIFVKLLNRSAQEYGYEQRGVLRIPCRVFVFRRVLHALGGARRDAQDLLDSLADEL